MYWIANLNRYRYSSIYRFSKYSVNHRFTYLDIIFKSVHLVYYLTNHGQLKRVNAVQSKKESTQYFNRQSSSLENVHFEQAVSKSRQRISHDRVAQQAIVRKGGCVQL